MTPNSESNPVDRDDPWEAALTQAFQGSTTDSSWRNPVECAELEDGRYQLLKSLGRGAMGEVFEALDTRLERLVAIKFLSQGALAQPNSVERFDAELRICAGLEHPGLVPVHDTGLTETGQPWFAMRKISGTTLSAWLQSEPPKSRDSALLILRRVAESVGFAHRQGIVHRDLKPDNILIGEDATVYVTDWGLACRESIDGKPHAPEPPPNIELVDQGERATFGSTSGWIVGTKGYMAPEQASGDRRRIGPWTDVFALAMVARDLIHATGDRESDSYLRPLLDRASAPDPRDRYPDAAAFALALEQTQRARDEALRATEEEARQLKLKQLADRRLRRRTALFLCLLGAVLAILLFIGFERRERARKEAAAEAQALALFARELEIVSDEAERQLGDPNLDLTELLLQLRTLSARSESLGLLTIAAKVNDLRFSNVFSRFQSVFSRAEEKRTRKIAVDRFRASFDQFLIESGRIGAWPVILPALVSGLDSLGIRVGEDPAQALADPEARPLILEALDVWLSILVQSNSREEGTRRWLTEVLEREDPDRAREDLRRALARGLLAELSEVAKTESNRLSLPMTFVLHSALVARGERNHSLQLLIRASDEHPSDFRLHLFLAEAYTSKAPPDSERALRHLTAARALNPGSAMVLAVEALAHLETKDFGEVDRCIAALRLQEEQRLAAAVASERYLRSGPPEEALRALAEQAAIEPKSAVPLVNRGQVLARLNRHAEAEQAFERALELDPRCVPALLNIGRYDVRRGLIETGLQRIDQALALDPGNWRAYRLAANAALDGERPGEALAYSDEALRIYPKDSWSQTCRSRALHGLGRFQEALSPLTLAIETASSEKTRDDLESMLRSYEEDAEAVSAWRIAIVADDGGTLLQSLSESTRQRAERLSLQTDCCADLAKAQQRGSLAIDSSQSLEAQRKSAARIFMRAGFGLGQRPLDPATEDARSHRERARVALSALESAQGWEDLLKGLSAPQEREKIDAALQVMTEAEREFWTLCLGPIQ